MKSINHQNPEAVLLACAVLAGGGIVMHPTETCYGLAVDIFDEEAVAKLYRVKGMAADKPVSVLVSDLAMGENYGVFSPRARELAARYWPGPLAIVVPRTDKVPSFLNPGEDFISLRCSNEPFTASLIREYGRPLTTTSANPTGTPQLYSVELSVFGQMADEIDLVVDGGVLPETLPSTLVRVEGDQVAVLRQGGIML